MLAELLFRYYEERLCQLQTEVEIACESLEDLKID